MVHMEYNLLIKLTEIQSSYTEDCDINNFIKDYIKSELKLDYKEDAFGNIYITKGSGENGYKCMVSHTDTVHTIIPYRKVFVDNGYIYAMGCKDENSILKQVGIGGDDRVGNYLCLKALEDFDNIKVCFFRFEESGCRGSKQCDMEFFSDCNFVIQPDRKGYGDFIRNSKGVEMCSDKFIEDLKETYEKYNFKIVNGISTDVNQLKENGLKVCAINLGCGYYSPHSDSEVIYIPNVISCYMMIKKIYNDFGDIRYEHEYEKPVYKYNSSINRRSYHNSGFNYSNYASPISKNNFSEFTNTVENNFFKSRLLKDLFIDDDTDYDYVQNLLKLNSEYSKFSQLISDEDFYHCLETEPFFINGSSSTIVFIPNENIYYNIKDNSIVKEDRKIALLDKHMSLKDKDIEFVYSRAYGYWVMKNNSEWDTNEKSWIPYTIEYKQV